MGHVRYWGLAGDDQAHVRAQLYYPFAQVPDQLLRRWSELMSIAVRTAVPPLMRLNRCERLSVARAEIKCCMRFTLWSNWRVDR